MSITDRDRKIVLLLVPIALIAAYWFLVLAPKRQEESKIKDQLGQAQTARDTAQGAASQLGGAKRNFETDYATVIYLGKSIPSSVDMPSLLVQLDRASQGTGIQFVDVKAGQRTTSSSTPASAPSGSGGSSSSGPASSGSGSSGSTPPNGGSGPANSSTPAQSGAGQAAQSAAGSVNQSNASSTAAGLPAGSSPGGGSGGAGTSVAGLDSVPLDFEFKGSFTHLADFFHRMKRFVRAANRQIVVRGRLIVINSFSFDSSTTFPQLDAKVHATVYLAPKSEGVAAGATPQGPAGTASPSQAATGSAPTPAATVSAP